MATSNDPLIGATLGERYRVERLIGRGGVGVVYQASARSPAGGVRPVVVKVLAPTLAADAEAPARFRREAERLEGLKHPNIVEFIDFGEDDGHMYIVMELLSGELLSERLSRRGRLAIAEFVPLVSQLLAGLGYAHSRGLIHRDLKPANIMLCEPDEDGRFVKILDFGLARLVDNEEKITRNHVVGTAGFLAPEQIRGEEIDQRADVYALGVLFYTMLSGRPPFTGEGHATLLYKHAHEAPPHLGDQLPRGHDVPGELIALVHRCLAKDPAERPADANELVEELIDCVDSSLIHRPGSSHGTIVGLGFGPGDVQALVAGASTASFETARTTSRGLSPVASPEPEPDPAAASLTDLSTARYARLEERLEAAPARSRESVVAIEPSAPQRRSFGALVIGVLLAVGGAAAITLVLSQREPDAATRGPTRADLEQALDEIDGEIERGEFAAAIASLDELAAGRKLAPALAVRVERMRQDIELGKLLSTARGLEERGNVDAALGAYRDILLRDPTHAEARDRLAALEQPQVREVVIDAAEVAATAEVTIRSTPVAELYVDDALVGETPYTGTLAPGRHALRLVAEGHREWRETVAVVEGANEPVDVELRAIDRRGHTPTKKRTPPTPAEPKPKPAPGKVEPAPDRPSPFLKPSKKRNGQFLPVQK
ncbi:MAG: protein kinase [Myxococcales bacterium]|nr:protein kinase [Myxococcales bacterium]